MIHFFFILLFLAIAFSQNAHYALGEKQSFQATVPPFERNTNNIFLTETFENRNLENNPDIGDFFSELTMDHSFSLDRNIQRAGKSAAIFELKNSDPKIWEGYRAEMTQVQKTTLAEGWYGFSQYFPDSYISDSTGEVVGQWHDQPDVGETTARSPSNAIITSDNRIKWMLRWDSTRIKLDNNSEGHMYFDLGEIPKNKWIDWVVHIKYSHTNTGILEVWMDGVKVIDRQNMPNSYNDEKYPYFKFGVYKWEWGNVATRRIIYYDEVRVGDGNSCYDEVKPGGY